MIKEKIARVIAAINHDYMAIESHWKNHPHTQHFVEDIRTFNVRNLPKATFKDDINIEVIDLFSGAGGVTTGIEWAETENKVDYVRLKLLWGSLECTNHSNAKGGLSRDADSRTLAEHLEPYVLEFGPEYIGIENVREFKDWGPLKVKVMKTAGGYEYCPLQYNKKEKTLKPIMMPDPERKGEDYKKWVKSICDLGYKVDSQILNAADFGAHTSRRRLFIIFAKHGHPIAWPKPTYNRFGRNGLKRWKAVKEVLDFSDKGENIFGRKKELVDNTFKRIYSGLVKHVADGDESFLTQYNGDQFDDRTIKINRPANTITTCNRFALVQPEFLLNYNHSSQSNSLNDPSPTLVTKDKLGMVSAERFIDMQHGSGKQNESIEGPVGAILPVVKKNLVTVEKLSFIDQQFGASKPISTEEPCNTLTVNPKYNLVSAHLLNPQYSSKGGSIQEPCFTLIARMDKRPPSLVQAFIMDTSYGNTGKGIDEAMFSLVASRRHPYLIQLETGQIAIEVYETDTEYMRKIKWFMACYGIVAIYMRMLKIPELLRITGLPEDYILEGTQTEQKKFIGNAVPPILPKVLIEALYEANRKQKEFKVAV